MTKTQVISLLIWLGITVAAPAQSIVAHRGASADAPENTLAAFRLAWELGADAAEGDFHLTADGEIVCHHDRTTERTGGKDLAVADTNLSALRKLDVGSWKAQEFCGEAIATLDEVLATVPEGKTFYIEVKCGPEIVPALKKALNEAGLPRDRLKIIAFDKEVIREVKRAMPGYEAFWLVSFRRDALTGGWRPKLDRLIATARVIQADGLDLKGVPEVVNESLVERCRDASLSVHVWTVDDPAAAREFARCGVASITTNRPDVIQAALADDSE